MLKLTPTERRLVLLIDELDGKPMSKSEMAAKLECSVKTVDRLISHLRRAGALESEAIYDDNGGQRANTYRFVDESML